MKPPATLASAPASTGTKTLDAVGFIDGQAGSSGETPVDIYNPARGEDGGVLASVSYADAAEVRRAVDSASRAFGAWRDTPIVKRCRILFKCKQLLEEHADELARLIVRENGKTFCEAEGEVRRGIEVVEFAAGMPSLAKGDYIPDIAGRVDGYMLREPLGVVVGACPFNFPGMIPMWMFPVAIACGNCFILKPSEKCPLTGLRLAELFSEGGLPDGVLNVVQGDGETFRSLIEQPEVRAVSFVGSTPVARQVWELAGKHHKRVQALGGAKNHNLILPDAEPASTIDALIGSAYGCAGERCMATSVAVLVGDAAEMIPDLIEAAKALKLGDGLDDGTTLGPLISAQQKQRAVDYLGIGQDEGAELILDGREAALPDGGGHFLGASIFDRVTPDMRIARDEIFGPVLCLMRADSLDQAIDLANASEFGNGASIFTASGGAAQHFRTRIQAGMIGINAGVPAPMAMFPFGGHKKSFFGDLRAQGPDGIEFYTQKKTVIERWPERGPTGNIWGK